MFMSKSMVWSLIFQIWDTYFPIKSMVQEQFKKKMLVLSIPLNANEPLHKGDSCWRHLNDGTHLKSVDEGLKTTVTLKSSHVHVGDQVYHTYCTRHKLKPKYHGIPLSCLLPTKICGI